MGREPGNNGAADGSRCGPCAKTTRPGGSLLWTCAVKTVWGVVTSMSLLYLRGNVGELIQLRGSQEELEESQESRELPFRSLCISLTSVFIFWLLGRTTSSFFLTPHPPVRGKRLPTGAKGALLQPMHLGETASQSELQCCLPGEDTVICPLGLDAIPGPDDCGQKGGVALYQGGSRETTPVNCGKTVKGTIYPRADTPHSLRTDSFNGIYLMLFHPGNHPHSRLHSIDFFLS